MQYIKKPFLPEKKVTLALIDGRADEKTSLFLEERGISLIKTNSCGELYDAVQFHPDTQAIHIGKSMLIVSPDLFPYYQRKLSFFGIQVVRGGKIPGACYPESVLYNCAIVGKNVFLNRKYTDSVVLDYLDLFGYKELTVKQGYGKCSICIVDETSIITEDSGIAEVAEKNGINALLVRRGDILLPGMEYGFIGGASGALSGKEILFFGDISFHRDAQKIVDFIHERGKKVVSFSNEPLKDYGSLIPLIEL